MARPVKSRLDGIGIEAAMARGASLIEISKHINISTQTIMKHIPDYVARGAEHHRAAVLDAIYQIHQPTN